VVQWLTTNSPVPDTGTLKGDLRAIRRRRRPSAESTRPTPWRCSITSSRLSTSAPCSARAPSLPEYVDSLVDRIL